MRITYLHQYFKTPSMSGGTRSYEMARRLVRMGHDVNMVTARDSNGSFPEWRETDEEGIRVHWLSLPYSNKMDYRRRIGAFGRFALKACSRAVNIKSDIIIATSTPLTIALPGAYAAKRLDVPMVFEVRDLWPELPIAVGALRNPILKMVARRLERFAYRRSTQIVALSPGMKQGIVKAGYPPDRVHVIPNSADLELFGPENTDSTLFRKEHPELGEHPIVLYAGTLGRLNGVSFIPRIAHAAKMRGSTTKFVVVGDGFEVDLVRETAKKLGVLGVNFHMFPAVSKVAMPQVLAAADIALSLFVDLQEMWANSANKFFDALASATPVAINYEGWQAQLLRESGAGLVLRANDPKYAAEVLDDFLRTPLAMENAKKAAHDLAKRKFSRDDLAGQLERVLLKAIR